MFYDYKTCHYNAMSLLSGLCQSYRFEKSQPDELTKPKSPRRTLIHPIFVVVVDGGGGGPGHAEYPKTLITKAKRKETKTLYIVFFKYL